MEDVHHGYLNSSIIAIIMYYSHHYDGNWFKKKNQTHLIYSALNPSSWPETWYSTRTKIVHIYQFSVPGTD